MLRALFAGFANCTNVDAVSEPSVRVRRRSATLCTESVDTLYLLVDAAEQSASLNFTQALHTA